MGKYHYMFSSEAIEKALKAKKEELAKNLANQPADVKESAKNFLKKDFKIDEVSDEQKIIKNAKNNDQPKVFDDYLESNNRQLKESIDRNYSMSKYIASPFVIKHEEEEIKLLDSKNQVNLTKINEQQNTLKTTKFDRNWFQEKFPWSRFKENKFVKNQTASIDNLNNEIKTNKNSISLHQDNILTEKKSQTTFESRHEYQLENMRKEYNNFVKSNIDEKANPKLFKELINKPQFAAQIRAAHITSVLPVSQLAQTQLSQPNVPEKKLPGITAGGDGE